QDGPRAANRLQFDDFRDFDLAHIPVHSALPFESLLDPCSLLFVSFRPRPLRRKAAFSLYRAQSTMKVPSLSPFSTARCACAVSDSANCPAILCMRVPAASHLVMSACAAASSGGG